MRVAALIGLLLLAACGPAVEPHQIPPPDTDGDGQPDPQPLPALLTDQVIVAHRGASGHAPEHTVPAWDLALEMGAEYIEQDILPTLDGVLVVIHDDTLDRTARGPAEDCTGSVSSKTLAQLKNCDMGSWFNEAYPERARPEYVGLQIQTLREVFERYGTDANYYIEIKPNTSTVQNVEQSLLDLIAEFGLYEGMIERRQVLIQSFIPSSLLTVQALEPDAPLVQLLPAGAGPLGLASLSYAFGVGPAVADTNMDFVLAAHQLGLAVHPYTINEVEDLEAIAALCVDGIFTNFPDRYRQVLTDNDYSCPAPIR